MKSLTCLCLLTALSLPFQPARGQEKTPDKTKAEQHARAPLAVKVHLLFTEMDGDKKVTSLPYTLLVNVEERNNGRFSTSLRTGVRVPVDVGGKDEKTTYMDVGANIDCGVHYDEDDKFRVLVNFDRSALYPNKSEDGERLVNQPNGQPLVRQFRTTNDVLLKDGQTADLIQSADPLSGHTLKVSITINVQK
jgi:hypothetical protein